MNAALLQVWQILDQAYQQMVKLHPVNSAEDNLFRVQILRYSGKPLLASDGQNIQAGDLICKIHLHNCLLMQKLKGITHQNRLGLYTLKEIRRSLPGLAYYVRTHPDEPLIKGIVGTTILYRGASQLGFSIAEMPPTFYNHMKNGYLLWMLWMCHPEGKHRLQRNPEKLRVKQVFMTKEQLYQKYGGQQEDSYATKSVARH